MTREETQKVLDTIEGSYKNFLMGRDKRIVFTAWYEVLKSQDFDRIHDKVVQWIMTKDAPPTISNLVGTDWRKRYGQAS